MNALTIERGDAKVWQFTMTESGTPVDLTGAAVYFTVRQTIPLSTIVSDADAIFTKTVGSGITLTTPANGIFEVAAAKADTNSLTPGTYYYGVEYVPNGFSEPRQGDLGYFSVTGDVVRAV